MVTNRYNCFEIMPIPRSNLKNCFVFVIAFGILIMFNIMKVRGR